MKERNLTLSPSCQDSPQGVLIPKSIAVTTHFAIKPTKKTVKTMMEKRWCPRAFHRGIIFYKVYLPPGL